MVEQRLTTDLSPAFASIRSLAFLELLCRAGLLVGTSVGFLVSVATTDSLIFRYRSLESPILLHVKWHGNDDTSRAQTHLVSLQLYAAL